MIKFLDLKDVTALHKDEINQAVANVVNGGWYLQGAANDDFCHKFAQYIGTRYCIGCGNGLDALTLILRAYKEMGVMKEGDEVIVPANTFVATILAITENRLKPVLVEPRWDTFQIDDSLIEQAITPRTRAIMLVHLYGRCAYTELIGDICRRHNLKLIEDNAQAHGCMHGDRRTGSLGDAAAHSFYPGKNLGALGEGGGIACPILYKVYQQSCSIGSYRGLLARECIPYIPTNVSASRRADAVSFGQWCSNRHPLSHTAAQAAGLCPVEQYVIAYY